MNRQYVDKTSPDGSMLTDQATMFIGAEVENTIMKGNRTLFVVGLQDAVKIIDATIKHKINHVYLGANHSFDIEPTDRKAVFYSNWFTLINILLRNNLFVTLDHDISYTDDISEEIKFDISTAADDKKALIRKKYESCFFRIISVKIPNIESIGYNTSIKIDDVGFNATNPGVWVHRLNDLKTNESYTHWKDYINDEIISRQTT